MRANSYSHSPLSVWDDPEKHKMPPMRVGRSFNDT